MIAFRENCSMDTYSLNTLMLSGWAPARCGVGCLAFTVLGEYTLFSL
jgi:hypothetical protein